MNRSDVTLLIHSMSMDELINTINDQIDTNLFPLGQIHEIDDEEYWDRIAERLGGYEMFRKLTDIPNYNTNGVSHFIYDEEQGMFDFFVNKKQIVDYFGLENIIENYLLDIE